MHVARGSLPAWPELATRLMHAQFVTIAQIRGRARGPTASSRLLALPDAELAAFVDRLARRIASFEQPAIAAAKAHINKRAGVSRGEDLGEARAVFQRSGTWPGRAANARSARTLPPVARRLRAQPGCRIDPAD